MPDNAPANPPVDIGTLPEETKGAMPKGVLTGGSGEPTSADFDTLVDDAFTQLQKDKEGAGDGGGESDEEKQAKEQAAQKEREEQERAAAEEKARKDAAGGGDETPDAKAKREADEKAEADRKAKEVVAAPGDDERKQRDKDLDDLSAQVDTHVKPTTRKIIDSFKANAQKARDEAAAAKKEAADARVSLEEARKAGVSKEVQEELSSLRDRVRSVDALADPEIVAKFQKPIDKNVEFISATFKKAGMADDALADLRRRGFTVGATKALIDAIETGRAPDTVGPDGKAIKGKQYQPDPDTAESLREAIRDNSRLAKARDSEIETWRATYDERSKKAQETVQQRVADTNKRAAEAIDGIVAQYDFLKPPPAVKDDDAPAVKKAKTDAIAVHNETIRKFADAIKKDASTIDGAFIHARVGVLFRDVIVPQLLKRQKDTEKKLADAEAELAKLKNAGRMSRTLSPTPKPGGEGGEGEPEAGNDDDAFGNALDAAARKVLGNRG